MNHGRLLLSVLLRIQFIAKAHMGCVVLKAGKAGQRLRKEGLTDGTIYCIFFCSQEALSYIGRLGPRTSPLCSSSLHQWFRILRLHSNSLRHVGSQALALHSGSTVRPQTLSPSYPFSSKQIKLSARPYNPAILVRAKCRNARPVVSCIDH